MKKFFLLVLVVLVSANAHAKSSNTHSVVKPSNGTCFISLHDINTYRVVNVAYIRSVDLKINPADSKFVIRVSMLSSRESYHDTSNHAFVYPTRQDAESAFKSMQEAIVACE